MLKKNHNNQFSNTQRLKSFKFAFNGLRMMWKEEHNYRIHIIAALLVVIAGFILNISRVEWMAIILSIGLVLATEIINTSIENLADFVSPGKNEHIKKVKDISAAGVLVAAISAFIIGIIIFLPKIIGLF